MAEMYPGAPQWLVPILNSLRMKMTKIDPTPPIDLADMSASQFFFALERAREEQRKETNEWCRQYISTGRWPPIPEAIRYWVSTRLKFALEQLAILRRLPGFVPSLPYRERQF